MLEQIKRIYQSGREARGLTINIEIIRESQGANGLELRLFLTKKDPKIVEDLDKRLNEQISEYRRQLDELPKPTNIIEKTAHNLGYIIAGHF